MKCKLAIASFLGLITLSCHREEGTKPIVQNIKELVFASGALTWKDRYNLLAQTDGTLNDVKFEVGDTVKKEAVLGKIDNATNVVNTQTASEQLAISKTNLTPGSPALEQLQQNIAYAKARYDQDNLQAQRYERLYLTQSVAKSEYETYRLAAENSFSTMNALKKQYAQEEQQARQAYINSLGQLKNSRIAQQFNLLSVPQGGTIIEKLKTNGDFVRKGDVIATIGDAARLEAVLNVDESSIGKIKVGQPVFVKLNTEKTQVHRATITEILAAFDEKTQSFICKAVFDQPIKSGFYGTQLEANVFIGEKKNALLIPRIFMDYGNRVFVKGKNRPVTIKPGIISSDYVEVLGGVTKEDVILPLKH